MPAVVLHDGCPCVAIERLAGPGGWARIGADKRFPAHVSSIISEVAIMRIPGAECGGARINMIHLNYLFSCYSGMGRVCSRTRIERGGASIER
jgi:hypothetical protein